jgi:hypothetical protein
MMLFTVYMEPDDVDRVQRLTWNDPIKFELGDILTFMDITQDQRLNLFEHIHRDAYGEEPKCRVEIDSFDDLAIRNGDEVDITVYHISVDYTNKEDEMILQLRM